MSTVTELLWTAAAILLSFSLMLTTFRLIAGPGTLDRLVSLDTFAALGQCALGLYIAWTKDTTPAAAIAALALIGFIGSVAVARFRVPDDRSASSAAQSVAVRASASGAREGTGHAGPETQNRGSGR